MRSVPALSATKSCAKPKTKAGLAADRQRHRRYDQQRLINNRNIAMNKHTPFLPKTATAWLVLMPLALLSACSKPPGCADPETLETMKSIVTDNVKTAMPQLLKAAVLADDPKKIQDAYYQNLRVEVVNVVSDGYNEKAKKNTCKGNMSITSLTGTLSRAVSYSTQKTEDKDGGFLVEIAEFQPTITEVAADLRNHYLLTRYSGNWSGPYVCDGIEGATDGARGPFTMPVTLVVDAHLNAKLERTTKGGGIEVLTGSFGPTVELTGQGKNSPDDTWVTRFDGKVNGLVFTAKGDIMLDENRPLRSCTLNLTAK
jgi:hypothetical protein